MSDLDVVAVGHPTGPGAAPVLFVHGVLDRGRSFDRVADELVGECRMWWYDRRGYASSLVAMGAPLEVPGHADDLAAIVRDLPLAPSERVVLVGHSLGGLAALGAAIAEPARVGAVVLYETGMAWVDGWADDAFRDQLLREDAEQTTVQAMFGDRLDRLAADDRARRLLEGRAFVAEERSVRRGRAPFDLRRLRAPLVYAMGDNELFRPAADHLRQVVERVEIVQVPGVGHNVHRSHPGELAALVRRGVALAGTAAST